MSVPNTGVEKPLAKLDFLAAQQLPIDIPSVEISTDGTPKARDPESQFAFTFVSFGIRFEATVECENESLFLRVVGNLGPVPYRAEAPVLRREILTVIRANAEHDVPIFLINALHQLLIRVAVPVKPPLTASTLISAAVQALVIARPYLELIEEKFMEARASEVCDDDDATVVEGQVACG